MKNREKNLEYQIYKKHLNPHQKKKKKNIAIE